MGSVFGGGGANTAFGAKGAAPILAKLTYWLAGGFMATCLTIEILVVQHGKSVLDRAPLPPAPAQTQTEPAQGDQGQIVLEQTAPAGGAESQVPSTEQTPGTAETPVG
jgi:preprotein translocase subunit SecG